MRRYIYSILLLIILLINAFILALFHYNTKPYLESVKFISYDEELNLFKVKISKSPNLLLNYSFNCNIIDGNKKYTQKGEDDTCLFELPLNKNYKIFLNTKYNKSKEIDLLNFVDNKIKFKFYKDIIYLTINEEQPISYEDKYILPVDVIYDFYTDDKEVACVENGKIKGLKVGETTLREKNSDDTVKIVVTDLITNYHLSTTKKEIIPCNAYTNEEAKLLDELLEYYINEAGYGTRAGAVAAGRFLTLQFKYRIPYFYENGRINNSGVHLADGEGRYYKKGLYLSEEKFKDIKYTYKGPAIWGCKLFNGSTNAKYGFIAGNKMPNGLDCSGFVSWALVNGGFDPGDVGAGQNEGIYQLTDTGEFTKLTKELAMSNKIKTGDLFNFWGHIALIIGQDKDYYYVAESLPNLGGVIAKKYSKKTVASHFEFVVLMDKFYKKDGNLVDYWGE